MANFYLDNTTYTALRRATNRVLLLHGVHDQVVPVRNVVIAASRITGSWIIQVPGAGHGVLFENVQQTIA
jgi:pimeloyl-ACP methyl ester carboxylesterase